MLNVVEAHYIHSYGRADCAITHRSLSKTHLALARYVVRESEASDYAQIGLPLHVIPDDQAQGRSMTSQCVLEHARAQGQKVVSFLDDDLYWVRSYHERQMDGRYVRHLTMHEFDRAWRGVVRVADDYPRVALTGFDFAHTKTYAARNGRHPQFLFARRQQCAHVMFLDRVPLHVRWDTFAYGADLALLLQLFECGYVNAITRYVNVGTRELRKGGCDMAGRTPETHSTAMQGIVNRWPRWVKFARVNMRGKEGAYQKVRVNALSMARTLVGDDFEMPR